MVAAQTFWSSKSLSEMNEQEWESLCDGCGKCCLHKLEDEDNGDVFYTKVACQYLDLNSCQCSDYKNRKALVAECITLSNSQVKEFYWLPVTCSYRILAEGGELPEWHPLVTGSPNSVHDAGISVKSFAKSEADVNLDDIEDEVINWVL